MAFLYWIVFWFIDPCPSVLLISSLIFSVIADIIPAEQRNTYLTRLEGCISAAYIIGPAVGGVLAQVNNHFPMLF